MQRPLLPAPGAEVLGVPLPLAGRLPAGPLPRAEAGIGTKECVTEGTPLALLPSESGHRNTSAPKVTPRRRSIEGGSAGTGEPEESGLPVKREGNQR